MNVCAQKVGGNAYQTAERDLRRANSSIVAMAQLKAMAVTEAVEGIQNRNKMQSLFEDISTQKARAYLVREFPTIGDAKVWCDNAINNISALYLANMHGPEFSLVLSYDIGYRREIENCEFATFFPMPPENQILTTGGKQGVRYITPPFNGAPTISASCDYFHGRVPDDVIASLRNEGDAVFKQQGFTTYLRTEGLVGGAPSITILASGQRSGLQITRGRAYR